MNKPRIPLVIQIMLGLAAGIVVGAILHQFPESRPWMISNVLQPAGDIFIRLMKMIVVPIVFACMVVGIAGSGEGKSLGRVGAKTLGYFFAVTTTAIIVGLVIGNLLQPGTGTDLANLKAADINIAAASTTNHGFAQIIVNIIPDNIVDAMAKGNLLPVLFFAVMFGLGVSKLPKERKQPLIDSLLGVSEAMFKITSMIMAYSPIGVFGMIAVTVANFGFGSLLPLVKLILVSYAAIIFFAFAVLGSIAKFSGIDFIGLIKHLKDELILAFSSASSAAVMPQLMAKLETFGAPRSLVSFVVPIGYSFNLDGASLFLGIGTLFVAQLYGIDLSLSTQALLVVTMVLTSKGAAGVPGFMFVILSATLASAGLPLEGIAFIAGVYRLMDMPTTALNVLGNALAPLVIAKWEEKKAKPQYSGTRSAAYQQNESA
ncbi:cation:dicarboxylate symporter family transporter [Pseudomonas fluorescens]|uniref:Cation:dicarboxylase symporter family transporter n=1 Tax=Pseudomonas fluorescens TaxID=294 RepID=A0A944DL73_PSEFL|nr:cation:dicarboxylase symporter family transporter [Pseudomonas fluorescens]MBT2298161.1 cation:dicarboxylase symporter family transporter [Pseudomonas fluorescens]MBT2309716.1 cation:dicarboxylase symporter family transporter [Pseudomonas fluorescens]MBT2314879.1 cation:dicarboxylase symporter family transporter [Pseudomonas fluorescens]MBT2327785.1 cation:dicarboxylase symporter family transporter [Pseudomonas fluorescens]MBT2345532.1 cation:dicarboxylase symporter family transporter [Pseu